MIVPPHSCKHVMWFALMVSHSITQIECRVCIVATCSWENFTHSMMSWQTNNGNTYQQWVTTSSRLDIVSQSLSTRISLSYAISFLLFLVQAALMMIWEEWDDAQKTGVLEVKETFFKAAIGNQTKNQLTKISSNATINSRSAETREATNWWFYAGQRAHCSNARVANCDLQMDSWEIKNRNPIAYKLSSKWTTDPSDWQGAPNHIMVSNNEFL